MGFIIICIIYPYLFSPMLRLSLLILKRCFSKCVFYLKILPKPQMNYSRYVYNSAKLCVLGIKQGLRLPFDNNV